MSGEREGGCTCRGAEYVNEAGEWDHTYDCAILRAYCAPDRSPAPDAPQADGLSALTEGERGWLYHAVEECEDGERCTVRPGRVRGPDLVDYIEHILVDRLAARDRDHEAEERARRFRVGAAFDGFVALTDDDVPHDCDDASYQSGAAEAAHAMLAAFNGPAS